MKRLLTALTGGLVLALTVPALALESTIQLRGLMDVVAQGDDQLRYLNQNNTADGNFDPLRTRLFLQGGHENTQVHVQFLFSETGRDQFRIFGAYLLHQIMEGKEIYLEAGRIPSHMGTWAPRTYSNQNPLVGIPLAQYWKSGLPFRQMPNDLDDLVSQKGNGQTGVNYVDSEGPRGTPWSTAALMYDNCWNNGAYILGTQGSVEYAFGATLGAPAAPVTSLDSNDEISLTGRLGYSPVEEMKVRISYARGAYLHRETQPYLPAGKSVNDYKQHLLVGSAELSRGYFVVNGEVAFNRFDTPLRADGLSQLAYYADVVYKFRPGWYAAARYDVLQFGEVETTTETTSWDQDVRRVETGIGYRPNRSLILKAVLQVTDMGDGFSRDNAIPAVQASLQF